jgi:Fe-S oxidoreductase
LIEARQLSLEQLETVCRVLFGKDPSRYTSAELKRDVLIYAKRDPRGFLNILSDPMLKLQSNVHVFFENKLLAFRNGQKEVWFNTNSNKKKMLTVPYGEDPYFSVANFFKSDEGIDALKMLENSL